MKILTNPTTTLFLLSVTSIFYASLCQINGEDKPVLQTYIIQVRKPLNSSFSSAQHLKSYYRSFMPTTGDSSSTSRMVYQYSKALTGFAAKLTEAEVDAMKKKDGFIKAHPERIIPLLTTHTPSFLGLQGVNGFWKRDSTYGSGVIIGMIDTGIDLNHTSFHDHGMKAPPSKWKGRCMFKKSNGCNKKLIGGGDFTLENSHNPPTDADGHGTHTASTAAENFVKNAALLGNANGTAAGMAPHAHLAVYKVCNINECPTSAVVAGMDAAIKDGVDIMSISLGISDEHDYSDDVIAIGAFSAMKNGIFVSSAAGNDGPDSETLNNEAPWMLTVGASTLDRSIRVTVKLGDGQEIYGESLYQPNNFTTKMIPLVSPGSSDDLSNCESLSKNEKSVKGKIVLCHKSPGGPGIELGELVKRLGGVGMILVNNELDGYTTFAEVHALPASHISYNEWKKISNYLKKEHKPTATFIFEGTILGNDSAPSVASFSSRGPNAASSNILKPDIIGPGVNILAGWPFPVGSSKSSGANFNIISGTSMATPHLSGIAALVKSKHPDWSPAAIKSALMTTSGIKSHDGKLITDEQHKPASYDAMGSGHVNPMKATDPGLVYDLRKKDYIGFLCGSGCSDYEMEVVTGEKIRCSNVEKIDQSDLNYPSFIVSIQKSKIVTVKRTVTYVGEGGETFRAKANVGKGFEVISVVPSILKFSKAGETKSFKVTIKLTTGGTKGSEGEFSWISNKHVVRSPLIVFNEQS